MGAWSISAITLISCYVAHGLRAGADIAVLGGLCAEGEGGPMGTVTKIKRTALQERFQRLTALTGSFPPEVQGAFVDLLEELERLVKWTEQNAWGALAVVDQIERIDRSSDVRRPPTLVQVDDRQRRALERVDLSPARVLEALRMAAGEGRPVPVSAVASVLVEGTKVKPGSTAWRRVVARVTVVLRRAAAEGAVRQHRPADSKAGRVTCRWAVSDA